MLSIVATLFALMCLGVFIVLALSAIVLVIMAVCGYDFEEVEL